MNSSKSDEKDTDAAESPDPHEIRALCEAISMALEQRAAVNSYKYDSFNEAAALAFAAPAQFSRFAGPMTAANGLVTRAIGAVARDADAGSFVLEYAAQWLPHVSGATPSVAWGLVDLVEAAIWSMDTQFTALRASRLLLISYLKSSHRERDPQHSLALVLLATPLKPMHVKGVISGVPILPQLLIFMGQDSSPQLSLELDIEAMYWSVNDHTRLVANALYGVRAPTLLKLLDGLVLPPSGEGASEPWRLTDAITVTSRISTCDLVALFLLSHASDARSEELGTSVHQLQQLLPLVVSEYARIDGPVPVIRNQLQIVLDATIWLLAAQERAFMPQTEELTRAVVSSCKPAVEILCAGAEKFKAHTCVGACALLRSNARNVYSLRTESIVGADQVDRFCFALKRLLLESPEHGVDEAVAGLLCNLLISFSPLRQPLIELEIIPSLCEALYRSRTPQMFRNVLWALRNACAMHESLEIEELSFTSLDRVGLLKPLLENQDMEVTRLFCALLGNVSPTSMVKLYGLVGGQSVVVDFLAERMACGPWPAEVQEAASRALSNITSAGIVDDDADSDPFSRQLCRTMTSCLNNPGASTELLVNIGNMIVNLMRVARAADPATPRNFFAIKQDLEPALSAMSRRARGGMMLQEGVYDALKLADDKPLAIRNSLTSARNALEMVISTI